MSGPRLQGHPADLGLAGRDPAIPGLACLLDDDGLSALLGEPIRITRIRYKPHTSALVAFTRDLDGLDRYGWAMARAPGSRQKLQLRAEHSAGAGGGIRFLHPDPHDDEAVVAVGGVGDDWPLRKNLLWLRQHGLERLQLAGFHSAPGTGNEASRC
ncbi:MAG: hypothetical protein M3017_00770 [Actinomycetota bacterium]|nr:hypothetical protein [Actinomycetota bacterium]